MARRSIRWLVVASLFTLANVAGLVYALVLWEKPHALVHLALAVGGALWVRELMRAAPPLASAEATPDLPAAERMAQLERSLGAIADEVDRVGDGQRELVRLEQERLAAQRAERSSP
jgi:hypothetical protein